ncbi:Superfamily II DNA or RNA helicase, SNF2 family [Clostridium cavendishii DSM 21758]|uniref:Superfamily II DNA or RNA helicase, SNF2 family n=1 Tax=Clostridium cavendishii DSM 21758 TaxID=1121302 RepID=A0A1M6LN59_9CLOT|nr:SNF2 helicase associated domain-containing protein [Clostridium cavendishii]SHJ72552.1 Superfamily II DNA or RNA helicase, SNF2 family [Clostridium cavendishii DSM 21758]
MSGKDVVNLVEQQGRLSVLREGEKVLASDLITHMDYEIEDKCLVTDAWVLSEDLFSEYEVSLVVDLGVKRIKLSSCTCDEYEKHSIKNNTYCCKHIMATALKVAKQLGNFKNTNEKPSLSKNIEPIEEKGESLLKDILFEKKQRENLKYEIIVKRNKQGYLGEIKIGIDKLYIVKDIREFIHCYTYGEDLNLGKGFCYNSWKYKMPVRLKEIITFINSLKETEDIGERIFELNKQGLINGKNFVIVQSRLKDFFSILEGDKVSLELEFGKYKDVKIEKENMNLLFGIDEKKNNVVLTYKGSVPKPLNTKGDVYLFSNKLYLLDYKRAIDYKKLLKALDKDKKIYFSKDNLNVVLNYLVPIIRNINSEVEITSKIKKKLIKEDLKVELYFDIDKQKNISLDIKLVYGDYKIGLNETTVNKPILRDMTKEDNLMNYVYSLGFEESYDKLYFTGSDEKVYDFLTQDIITLKEYGEVFYSQSFKNIKLNRNISPKFKIKSKGRNYFEFSYDLDGIDKIEVNDILEAFKNEKKFYKLKDGDLLNLQDKNIYNFLDALDNVTYGNDVNKESLNITAEKAVYLSSIAEEENLNIEGDLQDINKIKEKLKNLNYEEIVSPKNLKADLREYQKLGFKWFKTLSHLGFGGILGDEMGLGKTLQAISFISNEKDKNTLIVAPTSLIYNWEAEFKKFSPNTNILVVNGNKQFRNEVIKNYKNYDVIITSYNLLRIDFDLYKDLNFHNFFIDEAQNIKNPTSNISKLVKEINAESKFALTGTPIENSILELWSIFDFILPGYLYSEKNFMNRFGNNIRKDKNMIVELNKMIKPFILRRLKTEVIKELPPKIEKKLIIDMSEEQKKVYAVYVNEAKAVIEQSIKEEGLAKSKFKILSHLTKLRQLCLDPSLVMEDYKGESAKFEALRELLTQSLQAGHKILVFSQFTSVLSKLKIILNEEKIKYSYLDGTTKAEDRIRLVNEFNEGENAVFLISLKAGGTGLNLTSADVVIHFDPWWNPAVEDQATDRAHRFGQKNVVEVIKLIAKGSVEEKIIELQEEKKEIINLVLNESIQGTEGFKNFSEKDILDIFN